MTDIYRIIVPVGTCEHDIEWEPMEFLVGTCDDAYDASKAFEPCIIQFLDGPTNTWIEA
jgi:hypothetical protein